ncbi:MAG TPA: Na+/H+ antiporter NhaC family protein, partial [Bacillota bacterium]|nr:Na+/H+ antiporter NhaC family protein [Bacillota bacterium]
MKKKTIINLAAAALIIIAVVLCGVLVDNGDPDANRYYMTFVSLLPPIIAISLALITKEVYSSLFIGVLSGALFYAEFKPVDTVNSIVNKGFLEKLSDEWDMGILIFLVLLGIMVALINKAGGSAAFGRWAQNHIKTRIGALLATFVLGVLIFIDDYFNCLTVGSV